MARLIDTYAEMKDLREAAVADLSTVLLELSLTAAERGRFRVENFVDPSFDLREPIHFAAQYRDEAGLIVAEALTKLVVDGLAMNDPFQSAQWYRLTRAGEEMAAA